MDEANIKADLDKLSELILVLSRVVNQGRKAHILCVEADHELKKKDEQIATLQKNLSIDLGRLICSLPPDVNKKVSLHDLHRIAKNYNEQQRTTS